MSGSIRASLVILKELEQQGARLAWSEIDGRYRIGGRLGRRNVVIPRSRQQLIRLGCLRSGGGANPDLFLTETGRKLLKKFEQKQAEPAYRQRCSNQRRLDATAGSVDRDVEADVDPATERTEPAPAQDRGSF